MSYPHVYNSPDNFDVNKRPSDRRLKVYATIRCLLTVLFGTIMTPVAYVWISGEPKGVISLAFFFIGAAVFIAFFYFMHGRRADMKKAEFIAAGGDPTGITRWMFGAMTGRTLDDGSWEWTTPPSEGYGDG